MAIQNKQIGWSGASNLLHQLQKKLAKQNGNVPQEIGWRTEDKLLQQAVNNAACKPCVPDSLLTTTTLPE